MFYSFCVEPQHFVSPILKKNYIFYATSIALSYPVPSKGKAILYFKNKIKKDLFPICILNRRKPHSGINVMYKSSDSDAGFTNSGNLSVHISGFLLMDWKHIIFPKIKLTATSSDLYYETDKYSKSQCKIENSNLLSSHISTPISYSSASPKPILKKSPLISPLSQRNSPPKDSIALLEAARAVFLQQQLETPLNQSPHSTSIVPANIIENSIITSPQSFSESQHPVEVEQTSLPSETQKASEIFSSELNIENKRKENLLSKKILNPSTTVVMLNTPYRIVDGEIAFRTLVVGKGKSAQKGNIVDIEILGTVKNGVSGTKTAVVTEDIIDFVDRENKSMKDNISTKNIKFGPALRTFHFCLGVGSICVALEERLVGMKPGEVRNILIPKEFITPKIKHKSPLPREGKLLFTVRMKKIYRVK